MDITSLHYFRELTKDFNMTKTAARLYISPQTLSNHIQRLEQYYGTPLFTRKPSLALTVAGEFVLSFAQTMENENTKLRDILSDIGQSERGLMRFGTSVSRGKYMMSRIVPQFYERYPKVKVEFVDSDTPKLEALVSEGRLDFAIALDSAKTVDLMRRKVFDDQVYLCVPEALLVEKYGKEAETVKRRSAGGAQMHDFMDLPFAVMANRLGSLMSDFFLMEGCAPNICFTGTRTYQPLALASAGIAACYGTHMCMMENMDTIAPQVNIFPLVNKDGKFIYQTLSFVWNKGRSLSCHAKYILELLEKEMDELKSAQLTKIV